jgi:hypothetical protein
VLSSNARWSWSSCFCFSLRVVLRYAISDDIVCRRSISWRFSTSTVVTWCFCSSTCAWRIYPIPWWPHEMTSCICF